MANNETSNSVEDSKGDDTNEAEAREATIATPDRGADGEQTATFDQSQADEQDELTDDLQTQIADLEAELAEMKNRFLRAQADLENFRRRTRNEKEEQAKYASLSVIKALLPALDNLERALFASREAQSSDGLVQGVEMVNKQILEILEQEGLKPIAAVGELFNPEYHEAVMQVASDEYESGTVVEELQKGYQLKDRVIRPSMVKVSQ